MLITTNDLYRAYCRFRPAPDSAQSQVIEASTDAPLYIVAGPGTGKTATLSLRILKLILVDEVSPRSILATTFTVKAAAELRSRVLSWGYHILDHLDSDPKIDQVTKDRLKKIDINQIVTGTIDSICEDTLSRFREAGTQPPLLADDFVAKTLLLREGLFGDQRYKDSDLDRFLLNIRGSKFGWHIGTKTEVLQALCERRYHDQINWQAFIAAAQPNESQARAQLHAALNAYETDLRNRGMVDFTLLEQEMLERLRARKLGNFLTQLRVILVDEYQDTNLLQEQIYFELARACGGALTVVGDDDQSLYRFRGATVELFSEFAERYNTFFGFKPDPIFLQTNYRSTKTVVNFVNDFAQLDPRYQQVRVAAKPRLSYGPKAEEGIPILGMFRSDAETLAVDLAEFLHQTFRGSGYRLPSGQIIHCNPEGGDLGDCALLCSSPAEFNFSGHPRLPRLLREKLGEREIEVFNPRGQDLTDVPLVQHLGGLLLKCLDPDGSVQEQTKGLGQAARYTMTLWRERADILLASTEVPQGLTDFVTGWAHRDSRRTGYMWPWSVPVLDLIYGLRHFFPAFRDSPEGQVYLEVFAGQVSVCEQIGKFRTRVAHDPANHDLGQAAVTELLRNLLMPIASGTIGVNEDLLEVFPRHQLSILSIHQSKGLEFPLTIVDIGSDFKSNHHSHAFKRFPRESGPPHRIENLVRGFTSLREPTRSALDRAFDDLYRQYFVAYSRAQEILLLVGLDTMITGKVQSVAAGWTREGTHCWLNHLPFIHI
ncbi:MAG: hypothetical protein OHK0022_19260 [Roseiflexaceae bacterium]